MVVVYQNSRNAQVERKQNMRHATVAWWIAEEIVRGIGDIAAGVTMKEVSVETQDHCG
jgi:uncharacterized membrane protein YhiD involved in acid resistance